MDKIISFPDKKYQIIYADPPWQYNKNANKKGRTVESHYSTMETKDICALKMDKISHKNCVLFVWCTFPKLLDGLEVIEKWGFVYKTCAFVWIKSNKNFNINQYSFLPNDKVNLFFGMGMWTRANAEICLLATKGKPKRINTGIHQIIYSPLKKHSQKPDEGRNKIVQLMGDIPRIELFARKKHDGWDSWGDEIST